MLEMLEAVDRPSGGKRSSAESIARAQDVAIFVQIAAASKAKQSKAKQAKQSRSKQLPLQFCEAAIRVL
jgi:hypothetical protein